MEHLNTEKLKAVIENFQLPEYSQIPNVGLFLDQTSKYINEYLGIFENLSLTNSMISNYVKHKIIPGPVKKQYSRDHIAVLFFIAAAKSVLPLSSVQALLEMQKDIKPEECYSYFADEFKSCLRYVFGLESNLSQIENDSDVKKLLRTTIIAAAHVAYLNTAFDEICPKNN